MTSFFVLPGSSLMDLMHELELVEGDRAGDTMERYGYRAGRGLVRSLEMGTVPLNDLGQNLVQIWSETGLSRIDLRDVDPDRMVMAFTESLEAERGRSCRFMSGYLAGVVSELSGRKYVPTEVECRSNGGDECVIILTPSDVQLRFAPLKGPIAPMADYEAMGYELETGASYMIESDGPELGFEMFGDLLSQGVPGLCLVREYPERLRKRYRIDGANTLWLSYSREAPYAREPTNLPLIIDEVKDFMVAAERGVVLLSGIEYMISQSNFSKVVRFVQLLSETAATTDSMVIIPVCTGALDPRDIKMLERELIIVEVEE